MAHLIKTDGTITEVHPKNGEFFSLEETQKFVGGLIDVIELPQAEEQFISMMREKILVCRLIGRHKK